MVDRTARGAGIAQLLGELLLAHPRATVDQRRTVDLRSANGVVWRVGFEVAGGETVYFRTAIVRRGADVAQVTFTPSGKYDISQAEFLAIAQRAATRLKYAG